MELRFINESGRLRLSGFGVVSEREEGIESAIAEIMKRKGRMHLNKDCIFTKGEVEVLLRIFAKGHTEEASYNYNGELMRGGTFGVLAICVL